MNAIFVQCPCCQKDRNLVATPLLKAAQEIVKQDSTGLDADSTKLFIALDVEAFVDIERLAQRIDDLLAYLCDAEPGLEIAYPGDRGWRTRERYLAEGIPIHPEIVEQLKTIGVGL